MHVWQDVLWSSFTDELTKIARANAAGVTARGGARAMRMPKIKPPQAPHPPVGAPGPYRTKPFQLQPANLPASAGHSINVPSVAANQGAVPVMSQPTRIVQQSGIPPVAANPRLPNNMNPLTSGPTPS